jgi:hypothetical protein
VYFIIKDFRFSTAPYSVCSVLRVLRAPCSVLRVLRAPCAPWPVLRVLLIAVYFLLTMIAFSCALYNIITGRHFVKYWVPGGGGINGHLLFIPREDRVYKVCQSGEVETEHHFLTSCEAYST